MVRSDDGSIEVLCPPRAFYQDFSLVVRDSGVSGFRIGTSDTPHFEASGSTGRSIGMFRKNSRPFSVGDDGAIGAVGIRANAETVRLCLRPANWANMSGLWILFRRAFRRTAGTAQTRIFVQVAKNTEELRFTLSDDGTGISNFTATLDGKWILMRWDPKRERMWYSLSDGRHKTGEQQQLEITATDDAGNQVSWSGWVQF